MKYTQKRFTVPASAGSAAYCAEHGHTMPDVRGKCVRCGDVTSVERYVEHITRVPNDGWHPSVQHPGFEERDIPNGRQFRTSLRTQKTRGIPCS